MIKVIDILWLDKETAEAFITLSDGQYAVVCFSHPCTYSIGDTLAETLYCFEAKGVCICDTLRSSMIKQYNHTIEIVGVLIEKNTGLVKCNDFIFEIEPEVIHQDIYVGDIIEFTCNRIDTL